MTTTCEQSMEVAIDPFARTGGLRVAIRCPKCHLVQPPGTACRGCGLRVDRFAGYSGESALRASPRLQASFAACEDDWTADGRHEALAWSVAASGEFSAAARLYRGALVRWPNDPIATRQLARLARMAEAALLTWPSVRDADTGGHQPYRGVLVMLIVLVLLGAGGVGLYALFDSGAAPPPSYEPPRAAEARMF